MIDWFRMTLLDPIPGSWVLAIDYDGTLARQRIECRSSHETSLKIKSVGGDG